MCFYENFNTIPGAINGMKLQALHSLISTPVCEYHSIECAAQYKRQPFK